MSNVTARAIAICNTLESCGGWIETTRLLHVLNVPTTGRQQVLGLCHRLADAGVVERHKQGLGFSWKLAKADWDRGNPLRYESASQGTKDRSEIARASNSEIAELRARIETLESQAGSNGVREIKVVTTGKVLPPTTLENATLPSVFPRVLALAAARRNIMLVGPAGCGKTYIGNLTARALGLRFGSLSCTSGMSEAHLLGRAIPNIADGTTTFQGTDFLDLYENGGVFLLDELDAADPNLLLAINSAIANGYCNVPNRPEKPRAQRHPDFVLIATANTFGRGANRQYAGRNQLDEATLDRFRVGMIECDYEEAVEQTVCPNSELRGVCQAIRRRIQANGLRRIMSTRFIADAYVMHSVAGWTVSEIVDTFFEGWSADEAAKVRN
jgi:cobaltochelatase CobS